MRSKGVRLVNIRKSFDGKIVLKGIDLEVKPGEFLVLLGPSGCGKTTTLRLIAGVERVDSGKIFIGDREMTHIPPQKRNVSMVFQNYAVFPHMSVFDNIAFGLRMKGFPREEINKRVREVAELLKIAELLERYPSQLSGGQRQRVAVARALATPFDVLLMDEPLSNLDALLRAEMRAELKRLHKQFGYTVVYVTHDQVEALTLGDRIAVMFDGEIYQIGTPDEIYEFPESVQVGRFIGTPPMNFIEASVKNGKLFVKSVEIPVSIGGERELYIGIRPENLKVSEKPLVNSIEGRVIVRENLGFNEILNIEVDGDWIRAVVRRGEIKGDRVFLSFPVEKVRLYDRDSGRILRV